MCLSIQVCVFNIYYYSVCLGSSKTLVVVLRLVIAKKVWLPNKISIQKLKEIVLKIKNIKLTPQTSLSNPFMAIITPSPIYRDTVSPNLLFLNIALSTFIQCIILSSFCELTSLHADSRAVMVSENLGLLKPGSELRMAWKDVTKMWTVYQFLQGQYLKFYFREIPCSTSIYQILLGRFLFHYTI